MIEHETEKGLGTALSLDIFRLVSAISKSQIMNEKKKKDVEREVMRNVISFFEYDKNNMDLGIGLEKKRKTGKRFLAPIHEKKRGKRRRT